MKTLAQPKNATSDAAENQSAGAVMHGAARPARHETERALPALISASPKVTAQARLANQLARSPRMVAQRQALRGSLGSAVQLRGPEEEEPLQGKSLQLMAEDEEPLQRQLAPAENRTGMPDQLKAGIERLSGLDMSDVRVQANSSKPAQLNALAYAQGTDIHLAPGQEKHLPHEAWHVVQQAQGRVKPTMQMKDGVPVNDDGGLEHEADVMGERADAGLVQLVGDGKRQDLTPTFRGRPATGRTAAPSMASTFVDNRPEAVAQRELADALNNSPRMVAQRKLAERMHQSPRVTSLRALSAALNNSPRMVAQRQLPGSLDLKRLSNYHETNASQATQGGPSGKHEQANEWLTAVQGGTAAAGEFSEKLSFMPGFDLVVDVSKAVQAFQDSEASNWDKAEAVLACGGSLTGTAAGIGDTVKEFKNAAKGSPMAATASILGEGAAIFTTIQNGFALVKQIVDLITGFIQGESSQDRALAGAEIVKTSLEGAKSIIETINAFMSHLGSAATGMLQAVPALGIAISVVEWIINGINIGFSYVAWAEMREDKRASKEDLLGQKANKSKGIRGFFGGHESAEALAKDYVEGRALAAETSKASLIEQKIKTLTDQPRPFSQEDQNKLDKLEKEREVAAKELEEKKNKVPVAEEYLVSMNLQRIAAKRIDRGILNISQTLPSVAAQIAELSGVGAAVGAGLEAGGAGAKALASGIRMGKQLYHNKKGDEKSEANKLKMYDGLIRSMTQHAIDAQGVEAKEKKAKREIEASGMSMMTMARLQTQPDKLHEAWIAALKKR